MLPIKLVKLADFGDQIFVLILAVERAIQASPVGPASVKSEETQHQLLHDIQKQAKQSPQERMIQTEGRSNLKNKLLITT